MTVRTLLPEEYPALTAVEEGFVPDSANSIAVVAFDDAGKIVGRMFLVVLPHLEGTWVAPEARSGTIAHRMEREITKAAAASGLKTIMAYTDNETNTQYLERLGWKRTNFTVLHKELTCQ